ncbi:MAG: hypothetical protein WCY41_01075 [Candidatus Micrarchaeia archaeon]
MQRGAFGRIHAQASIETLLVFLIFLSAFGMAYAASSRLAAGAQARLDTSLSQSSFSDFSAKLQSACALGNGNVRVVEVKGKAATLSAEEKSITFTAGSFTAAANSSCEISLAAGAASKFFRIENKEGRLEIN